MSNEKLVEAVQATGGHSSTVEHRASNANVAGSSPAACSNKAAQAQAQAAEPVGWIAVADLEELAANRAESENRFDAIEVAISSHPFGGMNVPVYTHPQSAQDAKDAARYRFAQTQDGFAVCRWDETGGPERDGEYAPIDDEDVDAAMAKESGR